MQYYVLTLLLGLTLSGCASTGEPVKTAETDRTTLTCSGIKSWQDCRNEAREVCPAGFNITGELENILIQRREVEISCKT